MERFAKPVRKTPCVLCRTCVNWVQTRRNPDGCCAAGRGIASEGLSCDHYVRVFRPLPFFDRRAIARGTPDRRKAR